LTCGALVRKDVVRKDVGMRSRSAGLAVTASLSCLLAGSTAAAPPQSSPIAITPDDQVVVNVNPEANSISAFDVTSDPPTKLGEIRVGREPNSVAIHPNGTVAYVANSAEGTVAVVDLVHTPGPHSRVGPAQVLGHAAQSSSGSL
jgi:DNA-binding beta-propeller fold protein YncE